MACQKLLLPFVLPMENVLVSIVVRVQTLPNGLEHSVKPLFVMEFLDPMAQSALEMESVMDQIRAHVIQDGLAASVPFQCVIPWQPMILVFVQDMDHVSVMILVFVPLRFMAYCVTFQYVMVFLPHQL